MTELLPPQFNPEELEELRKEYQTAVTRVYEINGVLMGLGSAPGVGLVGSILDRHSSKGENLGKKGYLPKVRGTNVTIRVKEEIRTIQDHLREIELIWAKTEYEKNSPDMEREKKELDGIELPETPLYEIISPHLEDHKEFSAAVASSKKLFSKNLKAIDRNIHSAQTKMARVLESPQRSAG